jgi:hypothetical protein
MNSATNPKRRMARPACEASANTETQVPLATAEAPPAKVSRLDQLQTLLTGEGGASIADMMEVTG